jgi:hypothetical protein
MGWQYKDSKARWEKRRNSESLATAHSHREEWTDKEIDLLMEDGFLERGKQRELCEKLGRSWAAIKDKRQEVKAGLVAELQQLDDMYNGPIVVLDDPSDEDNSTSEMAARNACLKLTCSSIRRKREECGEEAVGSEDHKFELMEMYAMLGLME